MSQLAFWPLPDDPRKPTPPPPPPPPRPRHVAATRIQQSIIAGLLLLTTGALLHPAATPAADQPHTLWLHWRTATQAESLLHDLQQQADLQSALTGHDEAPADANGEGPQTTSGR